MTTLPAFEVTTHAGVHRYAVQHWPLLRPFVEGSEQDPKQLFFLAEDVWDLWPYARKGIPSNAGDYSVKFTVLRSFLKPFVKWFFYQLILQQAGELRTSMIPLPYRLKQTEDYLLDHGYTTLDDLAPRLVFEDLWASLLPQKDPSFAKNDVRAQQITRPFWLAIHSTFGVPLLVPPVTSSIRRSHSETGLDESSTYPARGKGKQGGLWFRFEPNKDGHHNQVHVSPQWRDLVRYCVKSILFYSDEVRHLALPEEKHLFILISAWNYTYGCGCCFSPATEHDTDYK